MSVLPLEGYAWAAIDSSKSNSLPDRGIVFMLRAKNEQKTIETAIASIHSNIRGRCPYQIVFIDNGCTDKTAEIAKRHLREQDSYVQYDLQLAKAGLEEHVMPCNSAHSLIWFYQWCLQQCTRYSHIFKWDADFEMSAVLADYLVAEFGDSGTVALADAYTISTITKDNKQGAEPYIVAWKAEPYYSKWTVFETIQLAAKTTRRVPPHIKIVHDSSVKDVKSYFRLKPWFESSLPADVKLMSHVRRAQRHYYRCKSIFDPAQQTFSRSMDGASGRITSIVQRYMSRIAGLHPYHQSEIPLREERSEWSLLTFLGACGLFSTSVVHADAELQCLMIENALGHSALRDWLTEHQIRLFFVGQSEREVRSFKSHRLANQGYPVQTVCVEPNESIDSSRLDNSIPGWRGSQFLISAAGNAGFLPLLSDKTFIGVVVDIKRAQSEIQLIKDALMTNGYVVCQTSTFLIGINGKLQFFDGNDAQPDATPSDLHVIIDERNKHFFVSPSTAMAEAVHEIKHRFQ